MSLTYRPPKYFKEKYGVSNTTLLEWDKKGKVSTIKIPESGRRLYCVQSVAAYLGDKEKEKTQINILYARVSSRKQKPDLERQIEDLQQTQKDGKQYKTIQDIASGINFKRKGLQTLLELVYTGNVESVTVKLPPVL